MEVQCTAKELIATLVKSSIPTVLVEGSDDMQVYRWIEDGVPRGVDVMATGGRINLLEIYKERAKIKVPIAFVADRDLWSFAECPAEYSEVIFTKGFSMENDVLDGSPIEQLFSAEEQDVLARCMKELSIWFAYEVEEYLAGKAYVINCFPGKILKGNPLAFDASAILPQVFRMPSAEMLKKVADDFRMKFRGKNLLALYNFLFQMRPSGRPKYSKGALLEIATKILETETKKRLIALIKKSLDSTGLVRIDGMLGSGIADGADAI